MESQSHQIDREDEEISLQSEDISEPALEISPKKAGKKKKTKKKRRNLTQKKNREPALERRRRSETVVVVGPGEDEEICRRPELEADSPESALETIRFGTDRDSRSDSDESVELEETENEETWLLPKLTSRRSEPVLVMTSKANGIGWIVIFSRPSAFICEPMPRMKRKFFSRSPKPMQKSSTMAITDMKKKQYESESSEGASALEPNLTKQEHGRNKDKCFLEGVYRLMKANVDSDNAIFKLRTPSGNTILHIAASYGNDGMVAKVAQHAPKLFSTVNDNYDTALHVAAKTGHGATIKSLLNEFLPLVRRKTNGRGHQSNLELMLMVSLTLFRNKQGNTFLHEAFTTSRINGAVIFEAFKAAFIVGDSNNFDEARYKKVVYDLATFEVNVEGKSLLYLTVEANREQDVNQLMNSCSKGYLEPRGKSPLLPALINKNLGMLKTILSKERGWIHLRNEQGWLPLHHAVLLGYLQGVQYLVRECPSCTMERDNDDYLPIHLACIKGQVKIVQELLKWCLDPAYMLNRDGQNLLHIACTWGNYELVRCLLEDRTLEIMINQKDINGNTPLHLATSYWHPKIVHALTWDKRVDLSVLNNKNRTALDIVEKSQGKMISLSQRLTWSALVSAGTPRRSVRFHPKKVGTGNTTAATDKGTATTDKGTPTTELYKDRIDTLILVSTLIITTSFAVGFTVPGNVEQGIPILLNHPMFHLFILSLTISAFGAISSTIILMWARLGDLHLAVFALKWGIPLLGLSLTSLSLAFLAGMYLIVAKLSWLATTFLVIGVVLILMVEFLYLLLLLPTTSSLPFFRYISYYPFLFFANIAEGKKVANKMDPKAIIPVL